MKKLLDKYAWSRVVLGALVAILGIILVVIAATNNDATKITKIICVIFGIYVSVLSGLAIVIALIVEGKKKTVISTTALAISLGVGLVFVIFSDKYAAAFQTVISYLVPMLLMTVGGVFLAQSIVEIVTKSEVKNWIPRIIFGAIFLALGIILIINVQDVIKWIYVVLGAVIVVSGIIWLVLGIIYLKNRNQVFKEMDKKAKEEEPKQVEVDLTSDK